MTREEFQANAAEECAVLVEDAGAFKISALRAYLAVYAGQLAHHGGSQSARKVLINLALALCPHEAEETRVEAQQNIARPVNLPSIASDVANRWGVSVLQIRGNSRLQNVTRARQEFMYLARQVKTQSGEFRYSTPLIGKFIGRDHTTVLHGVKAHQSRLAASSAKRPQGEASCPHSDIQAGGRFGANGRTLSTGDINVERAL